MYENESFYKDCYQNVGIRPTKSRVKKVSRVPFISRREWSLEKKIILNFFNDRFKL